jgi:isocitrate lyase
LRIQMQLFQSSTNIIHLTLSHWRTRVVMSQIVLLSYARQTRSLAVWTRLSQLRQPSTTTRRWSSTDLKPEGPQVSIDSPDTSFQLLSETSKAVRAEDALFSEQVRHVKSWWASERYKGIKRPYSAEDVVNKRGALQQTYPSSLMAQKLFSLLEERAAKGEPLHTSAFPSFLPDAIANGSDRIL